MSRPVQKEIQKFRENLRSEGEPVLSWRRSVQHQHGSLYVNIPKPAVDAGEIDSVDDVVVHLWPDGSVSIDVES